MVSTFLFLILFSTNQYKVDSVKIDSIIVYPKMIKMGYGTIDADWAFDDYLKSDSKEGKKLSAEECTLMEIVLNSYKRKKHWQQKLGTKTLFFEFYMRDKMGSHKIVVAKGMHVYGLIDLTKYEYIINLPLDVKFIDDIFNKYYGESD